MSAAFYIVLEKDIPGLDPFVNGKALSKAQKQLDAIAQRRSARPLMDFFSISPEEVERNFGEELSDVKMPVEEWYLPQEGLATVQTLLDEVSKVPELGNVKDELLEFEQVLKVALDKGVKWHLAVDY